MGYDQLNPPILRDTPAKECGISVVQGERGKPMLIEP